jgi:sensor histidine kinase YesM
MRYRFWILICGIWLLWGVFSASQIYFATINRTRAVAFSKALLWQLLAALLFALATPLVLWLSRRFRIERQNWTRHFPIHIAASLLIAMILAMGHVLVDILFTSVPPSSRSFTIVLQMTVFLLDRELSIYWIIVMVSHAFDYYFRYRSGEVRAAHLQTQLAQAQLQALKMQLHPHFLFNALNAIAELVYRNPEAAERMVTQLSDMLRLTLDSGGVQEVPLKQELDFLKKYLEIEQTRFQDRISVEMFIAPGILDASVPNMILQPLVENAVRYAIAPRAAGGRIEIHAHRENGMLQLEVCDDGRGLPADTRHARASGGGVGLSNTRARLKHLYGSRHRFELLSSNGCGLTVSMAFPFHENSAKSKYENTNLDR